VIYYLAPALATLREVVNGRWPKRDKASDGWIGDASHAARPSDHNPDYSDDGIVRALDIDVDDNDPGSDLRKELLEATIGDERVYYVISNAVIYSRTYGWRPRVYTGPNSHFTHVHVSIRGRYESDALARKLGHDTSPWGFPTPPRPKVKPKPVSLPELRAQFFAFLDDDGKVTKSLHVRRVQRALNARYGVGLKADGVVGSRTVQAWRDHETRIGLSGRPGVPDEKSLSRIARGRFRIVTEE
jgi:hypothetical protein